jgi:acylphosphatase
MERAARSILVGGMVQGVGFRYSTRERAQALGLAGWVKNLADGRVEIHAEGDVHALEELRAWLERGPRGAVVKGLDVSEVAPQGYTSFEIARAPRP